MPQDANYLALQQQIAGIKPPTMDNPLLDFIPMALGAAADVSGAKGTMDIVQSIMDRRRKADYYNFQNQLDLKKLQLESTLGGIRSEIAQNENRRAEAESAVRILHTKAETGAAETLSKLRQQEYETNIAEAPLKQKHLEALTSQATEGAKKETELAKEAQFKQEQQKIDLLDKLHQHSMIQEMKSTGTPEQQKLANDIELAGYKSELFNQIRDPQSKLKAIAANDPLIESELKQIENGNIPVDSQRYSAFVDKVQAATMPETALIRPEISRVVDLTTRAKTIGGVLKADEPVKSSEADGLKEAVANTLATNFEHVIKIGGVEPYLKYIFPELQKQLPKKYRYKNEAEFISHIDKKAEELEFIKSQLENPIPMLSKESKLSSEELKQLELNTPPYNISKLGLREK